MNPETRDNATSSLMRMAMTNSSKIPNYFVLVPRLIKELPFKGDKNEEHIGIKFLKFIYSNEKSKLFSILLIVFG